MPVLIVVVPLLKIVWARTALEGNPTTSNPASTKPSAHGDFGVEPLQVERGTEEASRIRPHIVNEALA